MEAAKLLGLSPGFKFQPTDEELVAFYLHPRLRDLPPPLAHLFIEDDPRSAPPWELLKRHGRKEEAFFFVPGGAKYRSGGRMERRCVGGGTWKGQKTIDGTPMIVNGEETRWRKYVLNFHAGDGSGSRGWVMHEYAITGGPSPVLTLCRIYRVLTLCGRGNRVPDESDDDDKGGALGGAMVPTSSAAADGAVQAAPEQGSYSVTANHQLALTAPGPFDGSYCTMPLPPQESTLPTGQESVIPALSCHAAYDGALRTTPEQGSYAVMANHQLASTAPGPFDGYYFTMPLPPQEPTLPTGQESVIPAVSCPAAYDGALQTAPGQGSYFVTTDQRFADQYPSSSACDAAAGPSTSAPGTTSDHAPFLECEQALAELLVSYDIENFSVSDLLD